VEEQRAESGASAGARQRQSREARPPTRRALPVWIRGPVTLFVVVWLPSWWTLLGAANFLWFSDLALQAATVTVWCPRPLLASMAALAVLLPELIWTIDFRVQLVSPFSPIGLASYMFDDDLSLYVRIMSGAFHLTLPPLLVYLVWRLGYGPRALPLQTVGAWIVLPISGYFSTADSNLNWTYGIGEHTPVDLPRTLYVALLMLAFPLLVYLPTDWLLRRLPTRDWPAPA
jgi:hypothetical protein